MKSMEDYLRDECSQVLELLLEKNKSYGNSAADPIRIFSKLGSVEQINIRIDDKLSRLKHGGIYGHEDTELDLLGYLILKRAVVKRNTDMAEISDFTTAALNNSS